MFLQWFTADRWSRETAASIQLAGIHARQPAAWFGFAVAALPFAWLAFGIPAARTWLVLPVAIACGGLAATASLGDPPAGLPDGRRRLWFPIWAGRLAWPLAGAVLAATGLVLTGKGGWLAWGIGGGVVWGGLLTAAVALGVRTAAADAALATSGGLLVAATAAVVALAVGSLGWIFLWQAAAASVAAAGVAWAVWRLAAWEQTVWFGLAAATGERSAPLVAIAMVTALAVMVGCFFLAPQLAVGYPIVALGWFICLAVPAATASNHSQRGLRLARSAVGPSSLPGSAAMAATSAVFYAAVLGWPAVVAMLLPAAGGTRSVHPATAVGCLATAAAMLLGVSHGVARGGGGGGETPRAIYLSGVAAAVVAAAAVA